MSKILQLHFSCTLKLHPLFPVKEFGIPSAAEVTKTASSVHWDKGLLENDSNSHCTDHIK